jgi:hypothetical protein
MKTIASALLALSVLAGFAATASAAPYEESIWPYLDRDNRGGQSQETTSFISHASAPGPGSGAFAMPPFCGLPRGEHRPTLRWRRWLDAAAPSA